MEPQGHHFLIVVYPGQGHINPARSLARRLAKVTGARVTFSTAISAHRQMFPYLSNPDQEITDGPITYIPYSDGYDNGIKWFVEDLHNITEKFHAHVPATLLSILDDLMARGVPVTCIIYGLHMYCVKELAISRGLPSVLYWPQPATVLGIYYHYFHGYRDLITSHRDEPSFVVNLPHLAPMRICDLPSLFTNFTNELFNVVLEWTRLTIDSLLKPDTKGDKSMILINTFEELECEALKSIRDIEVLPIGPDIPSLLENTKERTESRGSDLYETDSKDYMAWLNTKQDSSVVYVSFGSISTMTKKQLEEMQNGLKASGHPYLWVVRRNNREEGIDLEEEGDDGMVVEWCNQVQVLSHPSIGCFVTHCGWNSTLESLACDVPMVAVPQWVDQDTNAKMIVEWGVGLRGEVEEGVLKGEVLKTCLETIMGEGKQGMEIRENSKVLGEKARKAVKEGGSSEHNFKVFLEKITKH